MSRELKWKHSPTLSIEDNTSSEAIKSSINEVNSKIKNVPQKTKVEDGKLYLLNESGNKIDTGTTLPSGGAGGTVDLTDYAKKNEIPNKTSQLTNDSNFLTSIPNEYITEDELNAKNYLTSHQDISGKVDKVDGKQLSTEDYTTLEKEKLASLTNYDDTTVKNDINTLKDNQITITEENAVDKIEFI